MNTVPASFAKLGFLEYFHFQVLQGLACYGREPYSATAYNYPDEGESIIF
jgi:hypothetical protein